MSSIMSSRRRIPAALALALAAALTLSSCGDDAASTAGSASPGSSTASSAHNSQDVRFAQDMIPHHQQAVMMAAMAEERAASPALKRLAKQIEAAQQPEIETMSGWLTAWKAKMPSGMPGMDDNGGMDGMDGMDGMGPGDMNGMDGMGPGDMGAMSKAVGDRFDRMWLRGMIRHHEGAVAMASTQVKQGENQDAIELAKSIASSQTAEIEQMKAMLTATADQG